MNYKFNDSDAKSVFLFPSKGSSSSHMRNIDLWVQYVYGHSLQLKGISPSSTFEFNMFMATTCT